MLSFLSCKSNLQCLKPYLCELKRKEQNSTVLNTITFECFELFVLYNSRPYILVWKYKSSYVIIYSSTHDMRLRN